MLDIPGMGRECSPFMASDLDRALAATVREAVRGSRQSQTNVCLAIGLQPQAFRDRLRGRTRWAAVELQQLADVLGVSVTELLQPIARTSAA